jgi:hypothetical protein
MEPGPDDADGRGGPRRHVAGELLPSPGLQRARPRPRRKLSPADCDDCAPQMIIISNS